MFTIFRHIVRLRLGKPGRDLGGKLLLRLAHATAGHRLVPAGIGLKLGAVEAAVESLDQGIVGRLPNLNHSKLQSHIAKRQGSTGLASWF